MSKKTLFRLKEHFLLLFLIFYDLIDKAYLDALLDILVSREVKETHIMQEVKQSHFRLLESEQAAVGWDM